MTISNDDQAEALHLLSVVRAAQLLVLGLARAAQTIDAIDQITDLIDEVSRLSVFQKQAARRGHRPALDDQKLAEAIKALQASLVLNKEQQEARDVTPEALAELFSGNDLAEEPGAAFKI